MILFYLEPLLLVNPKRHMFFNTSNMHPIICFTNLKGRTNNMGLKFLLHLNCNLVAITT